MSLARGSGPALAHKVGWQSGTVVMLESSGLQASLLWKSCGVQCLGNLGSRARVSDVLDPLRTEFGLHRRNPTGLKLQFLLARFLNHERWCRGYCAFWYL